MKVTKLAKDLERLMKKHNIHEYVLTCESENLGVGTLWANEQRLSVSLGLLGIARMTVKKEVTDQINKENK